MDAVLWDFDGTLADSVSTNVEVTKAILRDHIPRLSGKNLPAALSSIAAYQQANHSAKNWRDLYKNYYGMTHEELLLAGPLWQEYQRSLARSVGAYRGIEEAVARLVSVPQAICSQNSKENILSWLKRTSLTEYFSHVVGYDCVAIDEQKPHPAGFLLALNTIVSAVGVERVFYVGDHEADTEFARLSELALRDAGADVAVIAVAVTWSGATPAKWTFQPDFVVNSPEELQAIFN